MLTKRTPVLAPDLRRTLLRTGGRKSFSFEGKIRKFIYDRVSPKHEFCSPDGGSRMYSGVTFWFVTKLGAAVVIPTFWVDIYNDIELRLRKAVHASGPLPCFFGHHACGKRVNSITLAAIKSGWFATEALR